MLQLTSLLPALFAIQFQRRTTTTSLFEASGETGETFSQNDGRVIKKHKPMVVTAENVKGITMRNKGRPPAIGQVVDEMRQVPDTPSAILEGGQTGNANETGKLRIAG